MRMSTVLPAILLAIGLGLMACERPEGLGTRERDVPEALRLAGAEWDRLFNARDAAGLAAHYADDVVSMPFNAPTVQGRPALQAEFKLQLRRGERTELSIEIGTRDEGAPSRDRFDTAVRELSANMQERLEQGASITPEFPAELGAAFAE